MVQLEKGQKVSMKLGSSVYIYGNAYTWFGGYLIR